MRKIPQFVKQFSTGQIQKKFRDFNSTKRNAPKEWISQEEKNMENYILKSRFHGISLILPQHKVQCVVTTEIYFPTILWKIRENNIF